MREEKRSNDISHDINGLRVSMSNNNAEERNDAYNFNDDGTEYRNIEQELKDEVRPYFFSKFSIINHYIYFIYTTVGLALYSIF